MLHTDITRDSYNAIIMDSLTAETRQAVKALVEQVSQADKVDEHGNWAFGAEFDTKGRGHALNWDLYAVGTDCHSGQLLAVIQVRQWSKTRRNGFANVRKNYFLMGTNEDETVFAHSVSAHTVHSAIRRDVDVVKAVQDWIFGGDYCGMLRQGDLAMVKMKARPAGTKGQMRRVATLQDSHRLEANQIADVDGRIYAKSPTLTHQPGTHPTISGTGWYRVIVGQRADFWKFAAPTID